MILKIVLNLRNFNIEVNGMWLYCNEHFIKSSISKRSQLEKFQRRTYDFKNRSQLEKFQYCFTFYWGSQQYNSTWLLLKYRTRAKTLMKYFKGVYSPEYSSFPKKTSILKLNTTIIIKSKIFILCIFYWQR